MDIETSEENSYQGGSLGKIIIILLLIFLPLIAFFIGIKFQQDKNVKLQNQLIKQGLGKSDVIPECRPAPTPEPVRIEGSLETYTSKRLKLSFSYFQPTNQTFKYEVKEENDKISISAVYTSGRVYGSKFIQVFIKNPQKSFVETIEEDILGGYPADTCGVISESFNQKVKYNPDFEYARIKVLGVATDTGLGEVMKKAELCPKTFTAVNSSRYFLMDKKHPDTYAFVEGGQDSISAYPSIPWDMTIRFLD